MRIVFIGLTILNFFFFSCKNEKEKEVSEQPQPVDSVGRKLTIQVLDQQNNPIKAKIYLENFQNLLIEDSISSDGMYDFGILVEGNYTLFTYATINNRQYRDAKGFQMIQGVNRTFKIYPYSNSGNIKVIALDQDGNKLTDLNVALLPYEQTSGYSFDKLLTDAWEIKHTDTTGAVFFTDLPDQYMYQYSVMFYRSSAEYDYPLLQSYTGLSYLWISKGETKIEFIVTNL